MMWIVALALGCGEPPPAEVPASTAAGGNVTSARGAYTVEWTPSPSPVPLNGLFEVRSIVRDARSGVPVELGALVVDARMPAHGHGMVTKPVTDGNDCAVAVAPPDAAPAAPSGALSSPEGGEAKVTGIGATQAAPAVARCPHPGGVYVTRGMKFHMPGSWTLTFDIDGPGGTERAEAVLEL